MSEQTTGGGAGWAVLLLVGVTGNAIGLIAGLPLLALLAAPLTLAGLIGLQVVRRRKASQR